MNNFDKNKVSFTLTFIFIKSIKYQIMSYSKYLIIHADDSGLAWSENYATQIGMLKGSISSTSLMVPCPWFYEMANFCFHNPELDYGIHLTLTGEWKTYPFRPCQSINNIPSLVDKFGHFYSKRNLVRDKAKTEEVYIELKSQIETAMNMGLNPSHLDSHMYTLGLRQDLLEVYQDLGREFKLPILLSKKLISYTGEDPNNFEIDEKICLESIFMASYKDFEKEDLSFFYNNVLNSLPDGLSILLIHPALKSTEMDQITLDHPNFGSDWRSQDAVYFSSEECKERLKKNKIKLVNWKSPEVLNLLDA